VRKLDPLALFAVVDAPWMVPTDPLTPTVELEAVAVFVARVERIANVPEVRFVTS
jgi:hypothetical protein